MIGVTVLGSGSRGNALLIDGSAGTVLVDAGFGARALQQRLQAAGRAPEEIAALVLTHEHVDHAAGAVAASARWGWPVYASSLTLAALGATHDGAPARHAVLTTHGPTVIGSFGVEHCPLPHDAADCRALVLTDTRSGARVGIVLDAGHVPDALPAFLSHVDLLVVEANHDADLLANGPYPKMLKRRISGGSGHLSNGAAAALAAQCAHPGLRGVMLAHLSETNNTPELALACTHEALRRARWRGDAVCAASQREPHAPMRTAGTGMAASPSQLSLF